MKLKTRIILGFTMIILMPLLLFAATLYGFSQSQAQKAQAVTESDGTVYDISITDSADSQGRVHVMAKDLFISAFVILISVALVVGLWVYRSIAVPLVKLKKATQNIKEGNLDFVLDVEGKDEFSELCQDFEEMRRRLKESTEEKSLIEKENRELISNISHDLKTPITAVKGYVEGVYRSIAVPLVKLKKATQNIKEGNLDFVLDVEGKDEFSELCQDFEEMRRRLKESTEEKSLIEKENRELISNISHDLKTPITAVKGYVEGIMDGVADTPEKMDRYVRTIYNKTNEMDHLINELTFYSKIDTNRIPYTFSKLNVEDYFEDCSEEVGLELETRGIELVYANYVEKDVMVIADGEQIRRVIHNIISNAIKYMDKPKGIIQIRIKDVGDFIQIEIEDNGKGIGPKDLPYIFDRFYRTDVSRNSSKGGSGIGLSIVKKILEDHGGKVWATSRLGIGTIMYFVLRKYQEVPMK